MARSRTERGRPEAAPILTLRLPVAWAAALALAWLGCLAWGYWGTLVLSFASVGQLAVFLAQASSPVAGLLARRLGWLAALWLLAAGIGALWVRALRLKAGRLEALLLAAGLGFGTLSLVLLALAAAGLYSPHFLKTGFLAAAGAALLSAPLWWSWLPKEESALRQPWGPWEAAALLAAAAVAALGVCGALTPEVFYDALVYHLALPKLYLLKGGLAAIPYNIFSGLPFAMQLLYGLALALADEKLVSLLHLSFGWAAAALIFCMGRRFFSRPAGVLAALAFLSCPAAIYAGWVCGVDLAAGFFCAGALLAALCDLFPKERAAAPEPAPLWPVCAGLLLGFSCGTKYNMLPLAGVVFLVHAWYGRGQGRTWKGSWLMAGAAAAAFSPWLVKNAFLFADPVYPYLRGLFPDIGWIADWAGFLGATQSRGLAGLATWEGWKALLLQPWTTSVGAWPMGDWPGPLFVGLVPWLLLMRPGRPVVRAVLAAGAGTYLAWAFTTSVVRYLLPAFPILALCAALALENEALPRWLRRLGWLGVLYGALFNANVAFRQGAGMGQWQCLLGKVSRADYLKTQKQTYPTPYYSAAEYINRELPPQAKVLLLGESRTYYIERDCVAATVFDRNPFWRAAAQARDGEDLLARVRGLGVTHVLLSVMAMLAHQESPGVLPQDAARSPAFDEFWARHLRRVFEDRENAGPNPRWLLVYEVVDRPDPKAAPTHNPVAAVLRALERR